MTKSFAGILQVKLDERLDFQFGYLVNTYIVVFATEQA